MSKETISASAPLPPAAPNPPNPPAPSPDPNIRLYTRRQAVARRQTVIFGWMSAILLALIIAALPFASGLISLPYGQQFSGNSAATKNQPPCLPAGKSVPLREVKVAVFNATSRTGFAGQTAEKLKTMGVQITAVGNNPAPYSGKANLRVGAKGVAEAYSVARLLPGASVQLVASKDDAVVDIVLGETFPGALGDGDVNFAELEEVAPVTEECQEIQP